MWRAKGKVMNTNTGGSPGYQNQSNSLEIHLVRKWVGPWTPTGTEPMDQWKEWNYYKKYFHFGKIYVQNPGERGQIPPCHLSSLLTPLKNGETRDGSGWVTHNPVDDSLSE